MFLTTGHRLFRASEQFSTYIMALPRVRFRLVLGDVGDGDDGRTKGKPCARADRTQLGWPQVGAGLDGLVEYFAWQMGHFRTVDLRVYLRNDIFTPYPSINHRWSGLASPPVYRLFPKRSSLPGESLGMGIPGSPGGAV